MDDTCPGCGESKDECTCDLDFSCTDEELGIDDSDDIPEPHDRD